MTQAKSTVYQLPLCACTHVYFCFEIFANNILLSFWQNNINVVAKLPSTEPNCSRIVNHDQRFCFSFILAVNFGVIFSGDFILEYFRNLCHTIEQFSPFHLSEAQLVSSSCSSIYFCTAIVNTRFTLFRKDVCAKRRYEY